MSKIKWAELLQLWKHFSKQIFVVDFKVHPLIAKIILVTN
jgi:hypothetical protein